MPKMHNKLMNALADSDLDCAQWSEDALNGLVKLVLITLHNPSDAELLAPGEPYRVQKVVNVSKADGIELRRKAWNKILDHMMENA